MIEKTRDYIDLSNETKSSISFFDRFLISSSIRSLLKLNRAKYYRFIGIKDSTLLNAARISLSLEFRKCKLSNVMTVSPPFVLSRLMSFMRISENKRTRNYPLIEN